MRFVFAFPHISGVNPICQSETERYSGRYHRTEETGPTQEGETCGSRTLGQGSRHALALRQTILKAFSKGERESREKGGERREGAETARSSKEVTLNYDFVFFKAESDDE